MARSQISHLKVALTSLLLGVLRLLYIRVALLTQIHVCTKSEMKSMKVF